MTMSAGRRRNSLRILTFTSLYPSTARPRHGIFVETRLLQIRRLADIDVRVVAPVPWVPPLFRRMPRCASLAKLPREEVLQGIPVRHPRYPSIPGMGMYTAPLAMAASARATLDRMLAEGFDFDLIDAHYFYPDGVAAAILARRYGKPLIISARGTDLNLLPAYRVPRRLIRWAARRADAIIAVSSALKERLIGLGAEASRIHVLRNGVDCDLFRPVDRHTARAMLGFGSAPVFLAVGNLVPEKGFDLVIDAVAAIPDAQLAIIGEGAERERLMARAAAQGIASRVHILAVRPQLDLAVAYSAADALVLASIREGWPNVLLEAMACGTPVVATDVGGVREIMQVPAAGVVAESRSASALTLGMRDILSNPRDRDAVRRYAMTFDWNQVASRQLDLCDEVVSRTRHRASMLATAS
ncbi:MAG: glycosyltransferase [Deltaproteobacteria bacterium]